ncbi:MAG: hypothetical protein Q9227_002872 [Pyrenula ochraceoflavens]
MTPSLDTKALLQTREAHLAANVPDPMLTASTELVQQEFVNIETVLPMEQTPYTEPAFPTPCPSMKPSGTDPKQSKRVAIVGGGVSGLAALWALESSPHIVDLYEAEERVGGHANTATFTRNDRSTPVDTGFIVYNETNYRLPPVLSSQILRFNHFALDVLRRPSLRDEAKQESISEYLDKEGYSKAFRDDFLMPVCAGIWSAPLGDFGQRFPAETLIRYLWNHELLSATGSHSQWLSIKGGSQRYIESLLETVKKGKIYTGTPVIRFREDKENGEYWLGLEGGVEKAYDHIIFATHADVTRRILGENATEEETRLLSCFEYTDNEVILHSDTSLMPQSLSAWSGWNYLAPPPPAPTSAVATSSSDDPITVTFSLNHLQSISYATFGPVLVTLNPPASHPPEPDTVQGRWSFRHPLFSVASANAQKELRELQPRPRRDGEIRAVGFAGAWTGFAFHEDGFRSGIEAARAVGDVEIGVIDKGEDGVLFRGQIREYSWRVSLGRAIILGVLYFVWTLSWACRMVWQPWKTTTDLARTSFIVAVAITTLGVGVMEKVLDGEGLKMVIKEASSRAWRTPGIQATERMKTI